MTFMPEPEQVENPLAVELATARRIAEISLRINDSLLRDREQAPATKHSPSRRTNEPRSKPRTDQPRSRTRLRR